MRTLLIFFAALLLSLSALAADTPKTSERVDVDVVDVPEKSLTPSTPTEIHEDAPAGRTCASCHQPADLEAQPKPLDHFQTNRDCGVCHLKQTWIPLKLYYHLSGKYKANSTPQDCISCHTMNTEYRVK